MVAILVPSYTKYVERSRESTDLANVRTVGEGDTENWVGIPGAGGNCVISLNADNSVRFTWSGGKESGGKKDPFDISIFSGLL